MTAKRSAIPQRSKVKAELQQEINSQCPFCDNTNVGHFQIHHIDENKNNNKMDNLLLVCPICHSKITKKDITVDAVIKKKGELGSYSDTIEFVSAVINEKYSSWKNDTSYNSFFKTDDKLLNLPIISFTFINHSKQTIILKEIETRVEKHPSGISGIPKAEVLKSIICYKIDCSKTNTIKITDPIQVPSNTAWKFDILFFEKLIDNEIVCPQGRKVLYLKFGFSNYINIEVPIYLNCKANQENLSILSLR